ncbi:MAG TPA: hypothetical protein VGA98_07025 [Allosphingosinicella sp.]|jgi:uncharacterized membrane protein
MASAAAPANDRSVQIGRIFSRAFGTIRSNPVATLGIALLFSAAPSMLLFYLIQTMGLETVSAVGTSATIAIGIFTVVISLLFAMITQGALVRATVAFSEGRKSSFGESATAGLRVAVWLLLLALLSALGIGLGLGLLIVPGVMLYIMWAVAAPALVEEGLGPIEALGRSRRLTKGARWSIFGLILILVVLYWLFSAAIGVVGVMIYGGFEGFAASSASGDLPLAYLLVNVVAGTITSAVWGVVLTSLYVELREWKDGPKTEALAEIFG